MATAVIVAVVVASGVVAVGATTRDGSQNTADPGLNDSLPEEPSSTPEPGRTTSEETADPDHEPSDAPEDGPTGGQFRPEVADVELEVDQPEYTGRCPVTLTYSARVTTNTGPVLVDYEWRDEASTEVEGAAVQFGGPGPGEPVPQGVSVTHEVAVPDDATVQRTLETIEPNVVTSDAVEAAVTCTPYAEITKGGDDFDAGAGLCHELQFDATITVPHDMTVTYEWLRSDGATDTSGPHTVDFTGGGMQTQAVEGTTWQLGDLEGEYGYRMRIVEPYEVTADLVAYDVAGCSGPAS